MAVKENKGFRPSIEDLLVTEITVGGDALDRALLYEMTRDYTENGLRTLAGRVRERCNGFYAGVAGHEGWSAEERARTEKMVDKDVRSWLRPWVRLAGRMEWDIERMIMAGDDRRPYEEILSEEMLKCSGLPEYAPFLEREMKGFAFNRCVDNDADYRKLDPSLRTPELEVRFVEEYPWLVESRHESIIRDFRRMCTPVDGNPDIIGYRFKRPFLVQDDNVIAFQTWKFPDRTSCDYAVFASADESTGKAHAMMPVMDLPRRDRMTMLERMSDVLRYSRQKEHNKGLYRIKR